MSQPLGMGPDWDADRGPLPNPYAALIAVWAAAALAELLAAALAKRRPGAAIVIVSAAILAGLAALLVEAMPIDYVPTLIPGLLAWFLPAVPLVIGIVLLLLSSTRSRAEA